jgi:hypothetical protein
MSKWGAFKSRVLVTPLLLLVAIVIFAVWRDNWWLLLGLSPVLLGWFVASPNLNMIQGCFPVLLCFVSMVLTFTLADMAYLVFGCFGVVSWLACSVELGVRHLQAAENNSNFSSSG